MFFPRETLLQQINELLSTLANYANRENQSGRTDFSKGLEYLFGGLLNHIYGLNLRNLNLEKRTIRRSISAMMTNGLRSR